MMLLGLGMLFVWSLVVNLFDFLGLDERVTSMEEEVVALGEENEFLEEKLGDMNDPVVQEGLIRDTLGLARSGETMVILPEEAYFEKEQYETGGEENVQEVVWRKWLDLLW